MNAELMQKQLAELLDPADPPVTNLANAAAFLYGWLDDVNWVGFYLLCGEALVLGPFQGKPACTRIPAGSGVCGAAIAENRTQRVDDVHAFPGHIACDAASKSELVVVLRDALGKPVGVLDVDSPLSARFRESDAAALEGAAAIVAAAIAQ